MSIVKNASRKISVAAMVVALSVFGSVSGSLAGAKKVPDFTNQGFLDAAHDTCAVEGHSPAACKCEQKLIDSDRLTKDDKRIAYYFWTDKDEYAKQYTAMKDADPEWQAAFKKRFTNLQALLMSACGKRG